MKIEWILCPFCGSKTRLKIRDDTVLENFPLVFKKSNLLECISRKIDAVKLNATKDLIALGLYNA